VDTIFEAESNEVPTMTEGEIPTNASKQYHENRQHALDRKRYTVEKITLFFLFVYVSVAAFQGYQARQANKLTQVALQEARQSSAKTNAFTQAPVDKQFHPWLGFVKMEKVSGSRNEPTIKWAVRTYGSTIARRVAVRLYLIPQTMKATWKEGMGICDEADEDSGYDQHTTAIFPNESAEDTVTPKNFKNVASISGEPLIAACAGYQGVEPAQNPKGHFVPMYNTKALYQFTSSGLKLYDSDVEVNDK
jgi:hypothetical protein